MSLFAKRGVRATRVSLSSNNGGIRVRERSDPSPIGQYLLRQYTIGTPRPTPLEKPPEPRLSLTFTCTVSACFRRSTHEFSKASYERGIVLVQCPGCKNRHLIADHLGWFKEHEGTAGGTLRTVEDLVRAKGEKVTRGRLDAGGVVEYVEE